jgi:two-component system OmpR family sensor kinase
MSIRLRMALWYGLAVLGTLALVATIVWLQFSGDLRQSMDEALAVQAADTAASLDARDGRLQLTEDPARPGIFTEVLDTAGNVLAASRNTPAGLGPVGPGASIWQPDPAGPGYALEARRAAGGRLVIAGVSLDPITDSEGQLAGLIVVAAIIATSASAVGGWWLSGRALRPVALLIDEAERIRADDQPIVGRLPVTDARDELGRLAATFNRMLDRVELAINRQRSFVAAASHDLRTPIAALSAELELALAPDATAPELRAAVEAALGDARHLSELTDDLLGLAAAEASDRGPDLAPVGVRAMVEDAARRALGERPGSDERLDLEVDDAIVVTDRVRVEQALANLLSNAIRWSPADRPVTVRARAVGLDPAAPGRPSGLQVDVLDRGPGVDPPDVPRLFLPFALPLPAGGTHGLGLATAAEDVRALGGRIGYRERPGGGAWFWFRIPPLRAGRDGPAPPAAALAADR